MYYAAPQDHKVVATLLAFILLISPLAANASVRKQIFLTPGVTSWSVPRDWNSYDNIIELIGPGGNGADATKNARGGGGGGGGGYIRSTNFAATPGASITVSIGA